MIAARDEEIQISWACAAQNPDLLPAKYRKPKSTAKTRAVIRGVFDGQS